MTDERKREVERRVAESRLQAMETLRRTIVTLETVIDQNRRLAHQPGHRASAMRRVHEGQIELQTARAELATMEAEAASA